MPEQGGKSGNSPRNSQSRGCEGNLSHVAEEMLPERLSINCSLRGRSIPRCSIESKRPQITQGIQGHISGGTWTTSKEGH
jgi:hypothetical protein